MHNYTLDVDDKRTKILSSILVLNVIAWGFISYLISEYNISFIISVILSILPITLDIIFYWYFENHLWKYMGNFIPQPYIGGKWEGKIISSYKKTETNLKVKIEQTWSKIDITLESEYAYSNTIMAMFLIDKSANVNLVYNFYNEAKNNDLDLNSHYGMGRLIIEENNNLMRGEYFTDDKRQTYGTIKLKKLDD